MLHQALCSYKLAPLVVVLLRPSSVRIWENEMYQRSVCSRSSGPKTGRQDGVWTCTICKLCLESLYLSFSTYWMCYFIGLWSQHSAKSLLACCSLHSCSPAASSNFLHHPPRVFKLPHLYSAVVRQTPPIMLDCSLVGGGVSFPPGPVLSLWSGQCTVPLEFSRSSHLQRVPEFSPPGGNRERERERGRISVT